MGTDYTHSHNTLVAAVGLWGQGLHPQPQHIGGSSVVMGTWITLTATTHWWQQWGYGDMDYTHSHNTLVAAVGLWGQGPIMFINLHKKQ